MLYLALRGRPRETERLLVRVLADLSNRDVEVLLHMGRELKRVEQEGRDGRKEGKQIEGDQSQWIDRFREPANRDLDEIGKLSVRRIQANGLIVDAHKIHLSAFANELITALSR